MPRTNRTKFSTANLNPFSTPYCLAPPEMAAFLPLLLNNTRPSMVQYSLAPLGNQGPRQYVDITARELRSIEASAKQILSLPDPDIEEDDDLDLDFSSDDTSHQQRLITTNYPSRSPFKLQKTQSLSYIRISKPGVIRLERVLDATGRDVRTAHSETTIVQCPSAKFEDDTALGNMVCEGESREVWLNVKGTAPMALKWYREVGGKKESFLVQGIEGSIHVRRFGDMSELVV
jgi:nucleoporin POM152